MGKAGWAVAAAVAVATAGATGHHPHHHHGAAGLLAALSAPAPDPACHAYGPASHAARVAIRFACDQLGKPYQWGGTGPDAYDCSGLTQAAWAAAGYTIPRVAADQFNAGHQIPASKAGPGDEVFFAGADGTPASPGHVGLILGNGRMVEAYMTGTTIRVTTYGTPSSPQGDSVPVGYTDPAG